MKVSVEERGKKFEPITLTLVIETREELLDMYVRHVVGNGHIVKLVNDAAFGRENSVAKSVGIPALIAAVNSTDPCALDVPLLVALKKEILK